MDARRPTNLQQRQRGDPSMSRDELRGLAFLILTVVIFIAAAFVEGW
jgi:nitrate reductase NapE component